LNGRKIKFGPWRLRGVIRINPIIYAELAPAFSSARELDRWLAPEVFKRLPLPYSAGWLAAAFLKYRRSGGVKTSPLPDFYIGAHAEAESEGSATVLVCKGKVGIF
jgi:predicted nucleic acid-binding protein